MSEIMDRLIEERKKRTGKEPGDSFRVRKSKPVCSMCERRFNSAGICPTCGRRK